MSWDFLQPHEMGAATWFYLSLLLAIAVFVRFNRVWSLRNWDLITLFLIVPGLLATVNIEQKWKAEAEAANAPSEARSAQSSEVQTLSYAATLAADPQARQINRFGYIWLFAVTGYFALRSLIDFSLVRRPRLEQNLAPGGIVFLSVCLFAYLILTVVTREPDSAARTGAHVASSLLLGQTRPEAVGGADPATVLFMLPPAAVQRGIAGANPEPAATNPADVEDSIVRSAVILCHLLIMAGLLLTGWWHFQSLPTGLGIVLLYLLLPVAFLHVMKLDHLIPAMFIVWAVVFYRHPIVSGSLMGLASVSFFPLFLLPAWVSFYWERGTKRFTLCFLATTALLWGLVYFVPTLLSFFDIWTSSLSTKVIISSGDAANAISFWSESTQIYRLPIAIVFVIAVVGSFFVPRRKNLGDLLAISILIMLLVQFWWADRGGSFVHWYLPLLLLLIFRPNLSEAVAPRPPAPSPLPAA